MPNCTPKPASIQKKWKPSHHRADPTSAAIAAYLVADEGNDFIGYERAWQGDKVTSVSRIAWSCSKAVASQEGGRENWGATKITEPGGGTHWLMFLYRPAAPWNSWLMVIIACVYEWKGRHSEAASRNSNSVKKPSFKQSFAKKR